MPSPLRVPPFTRASWAAVQGWVGLETWTPLAILFLWQIPHVLALARLHREDYARAGIRFLPVVDPDGRKTGLPIVSHCLALLIVGLLPALAGLAGAVYFFGALTLGVAFLGCGIDMAVTCSVRAARPLLLPSLVYLPAVLALMAPDRPSKSPRLAAARPRAPPARLSAGGRVIKSP